MIVEMMMLLLMMKVVMNRVATFGFVCVPLSLQERPTAPAEKP